MKFSLFVLGIVLFTFTGAFAADSKQKVSEEEQIVESISCKHEKDSRKLEVNTRKTGCALHYYKGGKSTEIAASQRGVELCRDRLKRVRATLEASGYQCR